jgi:hypothetical protein
MELVASAVVDTVSQDERASSRHTEVAAILLNPNRDLPTPATAVLRINGSERSSLHLECRK